MFTLIGRDGNPGRDGSAPAGSPSSPGDTWRPSGSPHPCASQRRLGHTFTRPDGGLIRPAAVSQPKPLASLALQLVGALLGRPDLLVPHLLAERHGRDPAFPATPPLVRREPVLPNQETRHHHRCQRTIQSTITSDAPSSTSALSCTCSLSTQGNYLTSCRPPTGSLRAAGPRARPSPRGTSRVPSSQPRSTSLRHP